MDYKYFASKPVALTVNRDGNCLYNSASLLLCGKELRSCCLSLLVAKELYFSAEYYAAHEIFKLTKEGSGIPEDLLFPVAHDGSRFCDKTTDLLCLPKCGFSISGTNAQCS